MTHHCYRNQAHTSMISPSSISSCEGVWLCFTFNPSKRNLTLRLAAADRPEVYCDRMEPRGSSWVVDTVWKNKDVYHYANEDNMKSSKQKRQQKKKIWNFTDLM